MSKRKLLLADDSVTIQKVVNLTFADEGIEVVAVGDGNAAMEKFVENVPDLVMVDVNMPGFDGYKICEIIKQDEETKHIPVILLVGSFEPFDEEEARRVGADDYLTKPFQSIRQLVAKVTGLLDSAGGKTALDGETQQAATNETAETSSFDNFDNYKTFPQTASTADETARYSRAPTDEETARINQIGSLPVDETQKFSPAFSGDEKVFDFADNDDSATESAAGDSETFAPNDSGEQPFRAAQNFGDDDFSEQTRTKSLVIGSDGENEIKSTNGASATVELDEMDLLELPFSDDDEFYDFEDETIDEVKLVENDRAEEAEQPETETQYAVQAAEPETEYEIQKPEPELQSEISAQAGEQRQNDAPEITATPENQATANFPPELIDAIAAKVVEKLSDKVIREIAWEVVPQMADLIIQKMAREKLS